MDTRRLRCLVVHPHGLVVELTVHERDAPVTALQRELRRHLHDPRDTVRAHDLELFVARHDADGTYLDTDSDDAQQLAFSGGVSVALRCLVAQHAMTAADLVHDHFPVQPPLSYGTSALVHVLARVRHATAAARPPSTLLVPTGSSVTARFVASAKRTRVDSLPPRALTPGTNGATGSLPRALVLRCADPHGTLWLCHDHDHDHDDTVARTLFVPAAWRVLASELFRMLFLDTSTATACHGRRAIIAGAPRSGKSAFLGFVLLQLLWLRDPRPVCVVDVPGVTFARIDADLGIVEGTRGVDFAFELGCVTTVYLFDTAPSSGMAPLPARSVAARSIVVAPHLPAPTHATLGSRIFALPLWTLDDIRICRKLCAPQRPLAGVTALFHKWGGVPGRLCAVDLADSDAQLERALAWLPGSSVLSALAALQRSHGNDWHNVVARHGGSDRWRALVVAVGCATTGFVFDGRVAFTSQYVCDRVVATLRLPTWTLRRRATPQMPALWTQIHRSLAYHEQEEEEKHETPPPAEAAGMRHVRGNGHAMPAEWW